MSADPRRLYTPSRRLARYRSASRTIQATDVEGFADLDRQLRENLPKATQILVLRRAGTIAMQPLVDRAQALAPSRTGRLRESVRLSVKKLRATARFGGALRFTVGAGDREAYWARWVEFGTVHMAAEPFMRPAFDGERFAILARLKTALTIEVRNAIERRAKRLAKKG